MEIDLARNIPHLGEENEVTISPSPRGRAKRKRKPPGPRSAS